jgi:hypothetical protein
MEHGDAWECQVVAAGRRVPDAGLLVKRHLGLTAPAEVWGARYFDVPPSDRSTVTTEDLLAAAALGVRITRESLTAFEDARPVLDEALRRLPIALSLADADDAVIDTISEAVRGSGLEATVAAKLLHRLRPRLVPPFDRATTDWYSTGLGNREDGRPPRLFTHMRDDLARSDNRAALSKLQQTVSTTTDGGLVPSQLRLLDIAIWMAAHSNT